MSESKKDHWKSICFKDFLAILFLMKILMSLKSSHWKRAVWACPQNECFQSTHSIHFKCPIALILIPPLPPLPPQFVAVVNEQRVTPSQQGRSSPPQQSVSVLLSCELNRNRSAPCPSMTRLRSECCVWCEGGKEQTTSTMGFIQSSPWLLHLFIAHIQVKQVSTVNSTRWWCFVVMMRKKITQEYRAQQVRPG